MARRISAQAGDVTANALGDCWYRITDTAQPDLQIEARFDESRSSIVELRLAGPIDAPTLRTLPLVRYRAAVQYQILSA